MSSEAIDYLRTETGGRLHIAPCPHLQGAAPRPARDDERASMQLCSWCEKEVSGQGRTYFDSLEDAMRAFGSFVGTKPLILEHLRRVEWDQIWLPNSRSYIALAKGGRGVAWIGKGYIVPAAGEFIELPGYKGSSREGSTAAPAWGDQCDIHHVTRSLTGECEYC